MPLVVAFEDITLSNIRVTEVEKLPRNLVLILIRNISILFVIGIFAIINALAFYRNPGSDALELVLLINIACLLLPLISIILRVRDFQKEQLEHG